VNRGLHRSGGSRTGGALLRSTPPGREAGRTFGRPKHSLQPAVNHRVYLAAGLVGPDMAAGGGDVQRDGNPPCTSRSEQPKRVVWWNVMVIGRMQQKQRGRTESFGVLHGLGRVRPAEQPADHRHKVIGDISPSGERRSGNDPCDRTALGVSGGRTGHGVYTSHGVSVQKNAIGVHILTGAENVERCDGVGSESLIGERAAVGVPETTIIECEYPPAGLSKDISHLALGGVGYPMAEQHRDVAELIGQGRSTFGMTRSKEPPLKRDAITARKADHLG